MISRSYIAFLTLCLSTLTFGQQLVITNIQIIGNERTKEQVVLRELTFSVGDTLKEQEVSDHLQTSRNRLMNLNLFNDVVLSKEGENTISIRLVEKWYHWPIPFIEFSDRNFNIWRDLSFDPERTNYGLYLFNYNLFGLNHTAKISAVAGYNEKYALEYRIPFISSQSSLGLDALISYESQNEVWRETLDDRISFFRTGNNRLIEEKRIELGLSHRFGYFIDQRLGLQLWNVSYDSAAFLASEVPFLQNNEIDQQSFGISYELTQDLQDNHYLPMNGRFLYFGVGIQEYNSVFNLQLKTELKRMNKLSNRMYSAFSVYGEYNSNQERAYFNNRLFGYDNHIRGFEPYVIDGHAGILLRSALRYHAAQNIQLPLSWIPLINYQRLPFNLYLEYFVESAAAANNLNYKSEILNNTQLWSTGLGANFLFYNDRIMRLEYSVNSLNKGGFYIHFKKAI